MIKDNILSVNDLVEGYNPGGLAKGIAARAKQRRLELNLTQEALSARSGVSFGTLKRFERGSEISLKNLLKLAAALNSTGGFKKIFTEKSYASFDEAVGVKKSKTRKRGRINA